MPPPAPPAPPQRPLARRFLAWVYTGPVGHLWSTSAGIAVAWTRWALPVARRRLRERAGRYSKR